VLVGIILHVFNLTVNVNVKSKVVVSVISLVLKLVGSEVTLSAASSPRSYSSNEVKCFTVLKTIASSSVDVAAVNYNLLIWLKVESHFWSVLITTQYVFSGLNFLKSSEWSE